MDKKPADLKDLLNYDIETYINENEIELLRNTFGREPLLAKIIRKIMLPAIGDNELSPEEMGKDIWLQGIDWAQVSADEAKALILGRQLAIKFIMGGLIQLKVMSKVEEKENSVTKALREKQNSTK